MGRIKGLSGGLEIPALGIKFGAFETSSVAVTMAYLLDVLCSPLSGVLMNIGRKVSLGLALLVIGTACGLLGTPVADSVGAVVAIACLAGAGNGISSGLAMTVGSDLANRLRGQERCVSTAEFLGPWREMMDGGMLLGPMVAGAVISSFSLPVAAAVCAGFSVAAVVLMLACVEETLVRQPSSPTNKAATSVAEMYDEGSEVPREGWRCGCR